METKLARISQLLKENPGMVFTSLGHLINAKRFYEHLKHRKNRALWIKPRGRKEPSDRVQALCKRKMQKRRNKTRELKTKNSIILRKMLNKFEKVGTM